MQRRDSQLKNKKKNSIWIKINNNYFHKRFPDITKAMVIFLSFAIYFSLTSIQLGFSDGIAFNPIATNLSNNSGFSQDPQITAVGSNVYVVWKDFSFGSGDILFEASTDNGTSFSSVINVSNSVDLSELPSIAASGTNVFLTWIEFNSTDGTNEIFFDKSTDNGANFDGAINLSNSIDDSSSPQIVASGSNVYVVWTELDSGPGGLEIFTRSSQDDGTSFRDTINLSDNAGGSTEPQIAASGSNVYVTWSDSTFGSGDTLFKASTDNGISFGNLSNLSDNAGSSSRPQIAEYGSNVYVVWIDTSVGSADILFNTGKLVPTEINFDNSEYKLSNSANVSVTDIGSNLDSNSVDSISVNMTSTSDTLGINIIFSETGTNTGIFEGQCNFTTGLSFPGNLHASAGDIITASFGEQTGIASIFSRTVTFNRPIFTLSENAIVTVTDPNSNLDPATKEEISITITSSTDSVGIPLKLTETGPDSGTFTNQALIFMTGDDQIPIGRIVTVSQQEPAGGLDFNNVVDTISVAVNSTSDQTGLNPFILTETGPNTGIFERKIIFTSENTGSNSLHVSAGNVVGVTYKGETSKGLVIPNSNSALGAIQSSVGDTITASFGGTRGTAEIGLGSGGGGSGGGLLRPGFVLDFISTEGGVGDSSPPSFTFRGSSITTTTDLSEIILPSNDSSIEFPFSINGNGFALNSYSNKILPNQIFTGDHTSLKLILNDASGVHHV
ncbi:MAG TPA: sialidase family protein, partial [Nitrosopumilaceae archaeon]|nr:sialidase family protein [Nitrosopumilaceae archaeon]